MEFGPALDGIINLAEFCFKLPPLVATASPLTITPAANDSPLQVTFKLRNDIPNLLVRLELSTDLISWDPSEEMIERLPAVPQPDGTVAITARVSAATLHPAGAGAVKRPPKVPRHLHAERGL